MLTAEENDLLTETGLETPMGQYFRRFWQPAILSEELSERDGSPIRVTIMREQLVAFRDSNGDVGLVDTKCPHRGADMYFGRNEECGLRCVYHGWKFDVHGKAVDLPNVPPGVRHHETVRIKSYPTREFGGIVWAYMGPALDMLPELPELEFGFVEDAKRFVPSNSWNAIGPKSWRAIWIRRISLSYTCRHRTCHRTRIRTRRSMSGECAGFAATPCQSSPFWSMM